MVEKINQDFLQYANDKDIKKLIRDGKYLVFIRNFTLF